MFHTMISAAIVLRAPPRHRLSRSLSVEHSRWPGQTLAHLHLPPTAWPLLLLASPPRPPSPPEAQLPPGTAADPPQPQHGTRHHYDRRERHPLRRCGLLCGHRRSSLCTAASPPAAYSLTSPPLTASSSPWQGIPSAMLLPPPSTQHTMVWCQSARSNGSQQASQPFCGQLVAANAAL